MRTAKKPIHVNNTGTRVSPAPRKADVKMMVQASGGIANATRREHRHARDDDGPLRFQRTKQLEHLRGEREEDQPHENHDATAQPERQPAAPRRLLGPVGAEVLSDQRHRRRPERRTG